MPPRLVLDRTPPRAVVAPELDPAQQVVVDHEGGPLLVLAGPGTGKTTTVVESVVARLSPGPGQLAPEQVLVLTFGRRAAAELRDRVVARLGGGVVPQVATFHSFAYGLVRQEQDPEQFAEPLRLLSGPEQESRLRELLEHGVADHRVPWPADLHEAVGTRGLAAEVRAVVAAMRAQGLDPDQLAAFGRESGHPAWEAVGVFADEYLDVLDAEGVLDYTELLLRAVIAAEQPATSRLLRERYRAVYVDEYQDTDPQQVRLLQALVTPATTLVAVGDPDQAIYSFRGADVGGLLRFRDDFLDPEGSPARVHALDRTRRFGPVLSAAAKGVLGSRVPVGLPADQVRRHRNPRCEDSSFGAGTVEVLTFDDAGAQAAHVAERVRRAVLTSQQQHADALAAGADPAGLPVPLGWHDVALLVRTGAAIPPLQRALVGAGVPVEVAGDEVPVQAEPAVVPLLAAARVVADPAGLAPEVAEALLLSPLIGADPGDLRRLGRALRQAEREAAGESGVRPRASLVLLTEAVRDPALLVDVDERTVREGARAVRALATLLAAAREVLAGGGSPYEVLWALWSGTSWPQRLHGTALAGGAASRRAHRDLDAVCALFDIADRAVQRYRGVVALRNVIEEIEQHHVPGETSVQPGVRGDAVRILTAHRAKGLEWRLVVVVGAQEGEWPDIRRRGSVLQADRIGRSGLVEPPTAAAILAEERRLFYVACTRAEQALLVTAVAGRGDAGPEPSRFLADLGVPVLPVGGRPPRPLSVPALVAELRRHTVDPGTDPQVREAATRRLALLASVSDAEGRPRVAAAHPGSWWGMRELTENPRPVRPADEPVRLSGSAVESLVSCPLKWFLEREVHADTPRGTATGFGSLVHVLADRVARGELAPDVDVLDAALEQVWGQLGFEAPWQSARERQEARAALTRFLRWHGSRPGVLVASEQGFEVTLEVVAADGAPRAVRMRGYMDVVTAELVDDVALVQVHDLKTGRSHPGDKDVERHLQLAVYQTVVAAGAVDQVTRAALEVADDVAVEPGGASLVQLRHDAPRDAGGPRVQPQPVPAPADELAPEGPTWIEVAIGAAADAVVLERFVPTPGPACRWCEFALVCPAKAAGQGVVP